MNQWDWDRIYEVFSFHFNSESPLIFTGIDFWIFFVAVMLAYVLLEVSKFIRIGVLACATILAATVFHNGDIMVIVGMLIVGYALLYAIFKAQKKYKSIAIAGLFICLAVSLFYVLFKAQYDTFYFTIHPIDVWILFIGLVFLLSLFRQQFLVRSIFLTGVSLFFYYKSSELFVLLLAVSLVINYLLGKAIYQSETQLRKKWIIAISAIINLFILGYFKYTYFFTDSFNNMFGTDFVPTNLFAEGANWLFGEGTFVTNIMLPVGVSFFTFQSISYVVDIYRNEIKPVKNFFDYTFFVTFFPQLVAGPIVRARDFIPQIHQPFALNKDDYSGAVVQIVTGLLKKVVLADFIAVHFIDIIADSPETYPGFVSVLAMFGYTLQIYGDFSGYTDIAIGLSRLMGFKLLENFNSPYKAINVADFWRRWHKSLGSWLRDYLYIPLGGNRSGGLGTFIATFLILIFLVFITGWYELFYIYAGLMVIYITVVRFVPSARSNVYRDLNLIITMVVGGLWHGASENFVIWGAMNGAALVIFNHWKRFEDVESDKWFLPHAIKLFLLFLSFQVVDIWFNVAFNNAKITTIDFTSITYSLGVLLVILAISFAASKTPQSVQKVYLRFWGILITCSFITLTRIWFRLEDDGAPTTMLNQILNHFNFSWDTFVLVLETYQAVFWVMLIGFIVHWLPGKTKVWYQTVFAKMPVALQVLSVAIIIGLMYQAMTGESKAFVYFQF